MMARSRGGDYWLANAHCAVDSVDLAGQAQPVSLQLQATTTKLCIESQVGMGELCAARSLTPRIAKIGMAC